MIENLVNVGFASAAIFAGWQSYRANKQTKATGNGFAGHVMESLEEIKEQGQETQKLLVQHLADHAHHDLEK